MPKLTTNTMPVTAAEEFNSQLARLLPPSIELQSQAQQVAPGTSTDNAANQTTCRPSVTDCLLAAKARQEPAGLTHA